jgi:hypothetical protein
VPAIVTRELWNRAHEAQVRNKIGRVGREPREYELSGLLWCARCGTRCTTFPRRGDEAAYRCNNIDHANRSIRVCHAPSIRKSILEPAIWNTLWDAVCDPGLLWQLVTAYHERMTGSPSKKSPAIARIDRARRLVTRTERILKDPEQPVPYEEAKADLETARRELATAQIAAGAEVIAMPLRQNVEAASAEFRAMRYEIQTFTGRRKALQLLIEKIHYADGEAEIYCHLPATDARNCHNRIGGYSNLSHTSFHAIPFILKRRVA